MQSCIKGDDGPTTKNYIDIGDKLFEFTVSGPWGEWNSPFESGKRGLLVFFTVGCPDCTTILPELDKLWDEYKSNKIEDFEMVMINRAEPEQKIEEYWTDNHLQMEYYLDPDRKIFDKFANAYVPRLYLIDRKGVIQKLWIEDRTITAEKLKKELSKL